MMNPSSRRNTMRASGTRRSERGAALVELAVALPMLVLLLVGTADFARVFRTASEVTTAARAGAQWGAAGLGHSNNTTGMQAAAIAAAPDVSGLVANATFSCACVSDDNATPVAAAGNACSDPETTACPGRHRIVTVTVTTTKTFSMLAPFPGLSSSIDLSRTVTMRIAPELGAP